MIQSFALLRKELEKNFKKLKLYEAPKDGSLTKVYNKGCIYKHRFSVYIGRSEISFSYAPEYQSMHTSSISVAKVRKPPNVAESYGIAEAREQEFHATGPITPLLIFVHFSGRVSKTYVRQVHAGRRHSHRPVVLKDNKYIY